MKRVTFVSKYIFSFFFLVGITASIVLFINLQSCKSPTDSDGIDTTGTNYSWQKFTFGGAASSSLEDVAIVNDTLIFAVGNIYVNDSSGKVDPIPFCLARWNGRNWTLKRLYYYNKDYQTIIPLYSIKGIFAFSSTDIWLAPGSVFHWNGKDSLTEFSFNRLTLSDPNATVIKLWGGSSSELNGVGNTGTIVQFSNGTWQKIESNTDQDISDIWGYKGIIDSKDVVLYAAGRQIFQLNGNTSLVANFNPDRIIRSVWFNFRNIVYAAGDGIFSINNNSWKKEDISDQYAVFRIRGTDINNIWATGGFGFTTQFNGARWTIINEVSLSSGNYESLDVKGNIVALVGFEGNSAIITIGTKK